MARKLIATYSNPFGNTEVNMRSNINFRNTIKVVGKDGAVKGERCPKCSGLRFKGGKISLALSSNFSHKKGCELG